MSAAISPDVIMGIDPTGAALTPEQTALVTAIAMIAGGGIAGALGQNAAGAVTSAENEALNNATAGDHAANAAKNGGFLTALGTLLIGPSQVGSAMVNGAISTIEGVYQSITHTNSPQSPGGDPNEIIGASNQPPTASGGEMVVPNACPEPGACGVTTIPMPGPGSAPSTAILSSGDDGSGSTSGTGGNATNNGSSSNSVWSLNPFARGTTIGQQLGQNLPQNFPVIDIFDNGMATSIKSLNVDANSYQSTATLSRMLNGYIDSVAGYNGTGPNGWAGVKIDSSQITGRGFDLVIPNAGSTAQQQAINQAVQYGVSKGVKV